MADDRSPDEAKRNPGQMPPRSQHANYSLTREQLAEVERIQRGIKAGTVALATDGQVAALWKKCGL